MDSQFRDDLISTALDGERVDVDGLRQALATDEGRKSLAAFVLLRAAVADDDVIPRELEAAPVAMVKAVRARLTGGRVRTAVAASIAILAVGLSFWLGTTLRAPVISLALSEPRAVETPPPVRVVAPAPVAEVGEHRPSERSRVSGAAARLWTAEQPPKPTRMLRFVPGVDWTSTPE